MYYGLDYGHGQANIDIRNGIRFGVIDTYALGDAWYDEAEADYGVPTCPKCGGEFVDFDKDKHTPQECGLYVCSTEHFCESCEYAFASEESYSDEVLGYILENDEYKATSSPGGDIFVIESPYYTHAQFCSPCAPGACHLENPVDAGGPRAYCFGPEWFDDDNPCPYPIYRVSDDVCVAPHPCQQP